MANKLSIDKKVSAVGMLCEGSSIRAVERITGIHRDTVMRLGVRIGEGCCRIMDDKMRNLSCRLIQVDEIWAFVGMKQKNVPQERKGEFGIGDVWTWTALDSDSKLMVSYMVGSRDAGYATEFMHDVADRIDNRIQLTTDGHKLKLELQAGPGRMPRRSPVCRPQTSPSSHRNKSSLK